MRLYDHWRSSSAWRVRIALAYKKIEYQQIPVDLAAGAQHADSYANTNRMHQVPVLQWEENGDTLRLSQSVAIIEYLEATHPEPPLLPADPLDRARAKQLVEIVNAGIQPLQNLHVTTRIEELGGDAVGFARYFISRGLAAMEQTAETSAGAYLVGDTITVADLFLVPQLDVARRMQVSLSDVPTLMRVETRCVEQPAFIAAHPTRQPDAPRQ